MSQLKVIQFDDGSCTTYASAWDAEIADGTVKLLKGEAAKQALRNEARNYLLTYIKPKTTLTTVMTHASSNGMSHKFKVLVPTTHHDGKEQIINITRDVARLCGFKLSKHNEIIMGGCGYSKSFQIGYDTGRCLWPNGTPEPHGIRNGEPDSDGGYAIGVNAY